MTTTFSSRQRRSLRVLTLLCFFHFSGLNNGFSFSGLSAVPLDSPNFAPMAIRSFTSVLNPFRWPRLVQRRTILKSVLSSSRVIEISSRRALRGVQFQSFMMQNWLKSSLSLRAKSLWRPVHPVSVLTAGENSLIGISLYSGEGDSETWLKLWRMDFIERERQIKQSLDLFQPDSGILLKNTGVEERFKSKRIFLFQSRIPKFLQRKAGGSDSDDDLLSLNHHGRILNQPL